VLPSIPATEFRGRTERVVEVRRGDGIVLRGRATFDIPRDSKMDPNHPYLLCLGRDLSKDDVPVGAELWVADAEDDADAG
jgi:hypothetical protein